MKHKTIALPCSARYHERVKRRAAQMNMHMSQYLRALIDEDMRQQEAEEEIQQHVRDPLTVDMFGGAG